MRAVEHNVSVRPTWLWVVVGCVVFLAAPARAATGACIGPPAQDAVACASGLVRQKVTQHTRARLASFRPAQVKRPARPPSPQRDRRWLEQPHRPSPQRSRQLLMQELDEVQRLLEVTPDDDGDHPRLQRRLAEAWFELAQDLVAEQLRAEGRLAKAPAGRRSDLTRDVAALKRRVRTARWQGVRFYRRLLDEHPRYCRFPRHPRPTERGCRDEVLFFLGYELEHIGRPVAARRAYYELAHDFPASKYAANAFLAFAELFFEEARHGHPELWATTARAYSEVLGRVPRGSPRWAYAQYKLAHVRWHEGQLDQALDRFRDVVVGAKGAATEPVARAALRDLVPVYAQAGEPAQAASYLEALPSTQPTLHLERLGTVYLETGQFAAARAVFTTLRDQAGDTRRCDHQAALTAASLAANPADVPTTLDALETLDDLRRRLERAPGVDRATRDRCANLAAALLAEAATAWHVEALGSEGHPGTENPTVVGAALRIYQRLDEGFTASRFRRFSFDAGLPRWLPHVDRSDWPTLASLRYAYADLQLELGDWPGCGATFTRAFEAAPEGPDAAEALFASAQCWQRVFAAQRPAGAARILDRARIARLEPVPLSEEQQAMLDAFNRIRCHLTDEPATRDQRRAMALARGRLLFEANHLEEAAAVLRGVAFDHRRSHEGELAARLYLETLERIRRHRVRPACVDTMETDLPALTTAYCTGGAGPLCDELAAVDRDLERLRAEAFVALGDRGGPEASAHLKRGAELYLALWNEDGRASCTAESPRCPRYAEVLANAARAFQAAHLLARAIDTRQHLVDPAHHLHEHPLAKEALLQLGRNHQAIASYDRAATWYERFADASPRSDDAATALSDAVVLRLGLGQSEAALKDARRFRRHFGHNHPREAATIALAVARHHASHDRPRPAERALSQGRLAISQGPLELRLSADALAARLADRRGAAAEAARRYRAIIHDTADPIELRREVGDGRALAMAMNAAAEARTFEARRLAAVAHSLKPPSYRGPGTRADLEAFLDGPFAAWLRDKRAATERAAQAYAAIPAFSPEVPPRWVVGAAAATGDLWAQLADELEAAPYPSAWDAPGDVPHASPPLRWHELRAAYQAALAAAVAPLRRAARAAYEACLERARVIAHFDPSVRRAEQWLARHFPAEHRALDEIAPPSRRHLPPAHRRAATPMVRPERQMR